MKLNTSKMIFLNVITLSALVSLSVNNWMMIWIMMELALFMMIPLISKNKISDQSMKYFIIQSTSSYILIFSILCNSMKETNLNSLVCMISLILKTGMSPFHAWKPEIMSKMTWKECMLLTTIVKIPPMILMNSLIKLDLMILPMILSLAVGSLGGMNQLNLKKLMAYSSIFNLTWMSSAFLLSKKIMLSFLILYSMLTIKAMWFFKKQNLIYMNQMSSLPLKMKMSLTLNLLSISGLPPLTGFFPKWIVLNELLKTSLFIPSMMILTSIASIFMYIQMNTFTLSNLTIKKKINKISLYSNLSLLNLFSLPILYMTWNI
uniref:NADH-ubiquinone oxidoreductase chain 2 n=1 Tax=Chloriona tateyamana TaxID=2566016 RepID=A0A7S4YYR3_9HEMI|nr:NADH dehydrogenase subunit 2 [Chloriona tateyamana]QBZ37978.1 NADH dehydrogenase subunit 2 [Chloriona tateyamana]